MEATCHVCFRDGFWNWEIKHPNGVACVICTEPYATAEELERGMEEVAALLRATCHSFFEVKPNEPIGFGNIEGK